MNRKSSGSMRRFVVASFLWATFASSGHAQCLDCTAPGTFIGNGNDVVFATHFPLGFNYPMAPGAGGVPGVTWSHFRVCTNGWLMLTNGVLSTGLPAATDYGSAASLRGPVGSFPRIAPFWGNLYLDPFNTAGIYYKQKPASGSTPASCSICWVNANDWSPTTNLPVKTFQAEIFATGRIVFSYSKMRIDRPGTKYVGVSWGNGNNPAVVAQTNLTSITPNARFEPRMYRAYPFIPFWPFLSFPPFWRSLTFSQLVPPSTPHGWIQHVSCYIPGAYFAKFGKSTPVFTDSLYQAFPTAVEASVSLTGNSLSLLATGSAYTATWGNVPYVPPSGGATVLALGDDTETTVALSAPFPTPSGLQASLRVHANGVVSWGSGAQTFPGTTSYEPTPTAFLNAANGGFWSWHDYNTTEAGSGQVKYEEVGNVAYITWDGVESYSSPELPNPSSFQFQLNLLTGDAHYVWSSIDGNDSSIYGSAHVVGYSPGGASADAGSTELATALPLQLGAANLPGMILDGSPHPVSTTSSGTTVTIETTQIPEVTPGSGTYIGIHALSFAQGPPGGLDLGFIGAPGVLLYLAALNQTFASVGSSPTQNVSFTIPPGVPPGTELFAQTFALVPALNAFGVAASNGLQVYVGDF